MLLNIVMRLLGLAVLSYEGRVYLIIMTLTWRRVELRVREMGLNLGHGNII